MEGKEGSWKDSPDAQEVFSRIPSVLVGRDLKDFNRKRYDESFERYVEEIRGVFRRLQQICFANPEQTEDILTAACAAVLDGVQAELNKPKGLKGLNSKALLKDTYKMFLVAYLTPAVFELGLGISQDFNEQLRAEWLIRYPGDSYELIHVDKVRSGFESSWKKCYITQAVCSYLGREDDGYELTAFRNFRDTYLASSPDGPELIAEYYDSAPQVEMAIEFSGNAGREYPRLWSEYLSFCLKDIESGKLVECRERYVRMVRELKAHYTPWEKFTA